MFLFRLQLRVTKTSWYFTLILTVSPPFNTRTTPLRQDLLLMIPHLRNSPSNTKSWPVLCWNTWEHRELKLHNVHGNLCYLPLQNEYYPMQGYKVSPKIYDEGGVAVLSKRVLIGWFQWLPDLQFQIILKHHPKVFQLASTQALLRLQLPAAHRAHSSPS